MVELRWSKLALDDLEEIIDYISKDSEENARIYAAKIISSVETTSIFPYSGRVVPEMENEQLREKVFHNIRIIYRINNEMMEVIRVLHSSRELPEIDF